MTLSIASTIEVFGVLGTVGGDMDWMNGLDWNTVPIPQSVDNVNTALPFYLYFTHTTGITSSVPIANRFLSFLAAI
jgi:hypothetical protein